MPRLTASSVNSLGVQSLIGRPLEAGKTHRQGDDLDNLLHGEFRLRPRSEFIAQHGLNQLPQFESAEEGSLPRPSASLLPAANGLAMPGLGYDSVPVVPIARVFFFPWAAPKINCARRTKR